MTGIVFDIGTTTLEAGLFCGAREPAATLSFPNPQIKFGADVLSRIAVCPGSLEEEQNLILAALSDAAHTLLDSAPESFAGESRTGKLPAVISGNTTMLHILLGVDPTPLGRAPFTPAWRGARKLDGKYIDARLSDALVLPFHSAFIGADVIAGLIAVAEKKRKPPYLLADLGTNAELALVLDDRILCASAAAGPALECGNIECGSGGVDGAVCRVRLTDGSFDIGTVGKAPARSICGSGLVDTVALLLSHGLISREGRLGVPPDAGKIPPALAARVADRKFNIAPGVYISQNDIHQLRLAKSAVSTALGILLGRAGITTDGLHAVFLAGGLGNHISPASAVRIRLLPDGVPIIPVGNTSLYGAALCLEDGGAALAERTESACRTVMLGGSPEFGENFIENLIF